MSPFVNVDAGELPDEPEALYRLAQLVNVACGGHAGDAASMARVVGIAASAGTSVGAHPSYPDREGFGRRTVTIDAAALEQSLTDQCSMLERIARVAGTEVVSVKPHGALYHDAARDPAIARLVVRAAVAAHGSAVAIIGPARSALARAAALSSLAFWREGFADRGVRADGSLVPRGEPGDLVTDPRRASLRALELALSNEVDTICVHGDTPGALDVLTAVRAALAS